MGGKVGKKIPVTNPAAKELLQGTRGILDRGIGVENKIKEQIGEFGARKYVERVYGSSIKSEIDIPIRGRRGPSILDITWELKSKKIVVVEAKYDKSTLGRTMQIKFGGDSAGVIQIIKTQKKTLQFSPEWFQDRITELRRKGHHRVANKLDQAWRNGDIIALKIQTDAIGNVKRVVNHTDSWNTFINEGRTPRTKQQHRSTVSKTLVPRSGRKTSKTATSSGKRKTSATSNKNRVGGVGHRAERGQENPRDKGVGHRAVSNRISDVPRPKSGSPSRTRPTPKARVPQRTKAGLRRFTGGGGKIRIPSSLAGIGIAALAVTAFIVAPLLDELLSKAALRKFLKELDKRSVDIFMSRANGEWVVVNVTTEEPQVVDIFGVDPQIIEFVSLTVESGRSKKEALLGPLQSFRRKKPSTHISKMRQPKRGRKFELYQVILEPFEPVGLPTSIKPRAPAGIAGAYRVEQVLEFNISDSEPRVKEIKKIVANRRIVIGSLGGKTMYIDKLDEETYTIDRFNFDSLKSRIAVDATFFNPPNGYVVKSTLKYYAVGMFGEEERLWEKFEAGYPPSLYNFGEIIWRKEQ